MKIAIVTMDGETVSQHFGRSPYYKIYTIEDGDPVSVEMRRRGTGHFAPSADDDPHVMEHHVDERGHGFDEGARVRHTMMAAELSDCDVLVAGGMGRGAYESFRHAGLQVILTDLLDINDVVNAWVNGTLKNMGEERTD